METNIIKNLQQKILEFKDEIQKIESAIEVIKRNTGSSSRIIEDKPEKKIQSKKEKSSLTTKKGQNLVKKPISKQVIDYLLEVDRFLFPSEIISELTIRSGKKTEAVRSLVNQTLSRLKKEDKLVSFKTEHSRSHAWGFKNWVNEYNKPHHSHLPSTAE